MTIFNDAKMNVKSIHPIHDSLGEAVCQKKEEFLGFQRNTNVIVYSHVTAYARVRLARDMLHLSKEGCRIFYCDTGKDFS